MRRGKSIVGPSEFIGEMPQDQLVDPDNVNTRFTFDAGSDLFPRSYMGRKTVSKNEEAQNDSVEADVQGSEVPQTVPKIALNSKVPSLRKTKITLHGRISELFSGKLTTKTQPHIVSKESAAPASYITEPIREEMPIREQEAIRESVTQQIEAETRPEMPLAETAFIPTPVKRSRIPKAESVPKPAKPLKIIRRRREEEPKIFETSREDVPKSMLEGTTIGYDEELEPAR